MCVSVVVVGVYLAFDVCWRLCVCCTLVYDSLSLSLALCSCVLICVFVCVCVCFGLFAHIAGLEAKATSSNSSTAGCPAIAAVAIGFDKGLAVRQRTSIAGFLVGGIVIMKLKLGKLMQVATFGEFKGPTDPELLLITKHMELILDK